MQRKHAAASVTRCTIHLPPTAVGEGDYGVPFAGRSQGSTISHRSIWESLRHSESGTHLLGVHAELEITLANGHMDIHSRFHQQDAGSHAFIAAKVSPTRRGQPRFPFSQSYINKTGAATISLQLRFYQQIYTNKCTFPHGGPVHFLPLLG